MDERCGDPARAATAAAVETIHRAESRRVLASLIRLLGDFDLAEEALQDAFTAALETWPRDGVPAKPRAWLVSAGRFRALDTLRRRARFDASLADLAARADAAADAAFADDAALDGTASAGPGVTDDRLRLIFTCCHPALGPEARVALTLREVCGLTTEEIARAFLAAPATIAQRIVRAKATLRERRIPFDVPPPAELAARLDTVLLVVYLVFNEGWSASAGAAAMRCDLASEAIRLARLIVELLPEPEAEGLLGLLLLHDSRRAARTDGAGEIVLLDDQDRSLWNRAQIEEGAALVERALRSRRFGPFTIQGAIAAVHAESASAQTTDWPQIAGLYDVLLRIAPSPVVELNRAIAIGMRDGPAAALALIDAILARGDLASYQPAHAARAEMLRRLGRRREARDAFAAALRLSRQEPERRLLASRIDEMERA